MNCSNIFSSFCFEKYKIPAYCENNALWKNWRQIVPIKIGFRLNYLVKFIQKIKKNLVYEFRFLHEFDSLIDLFCSWISECLIATLLLHDATRRKLISGSWFSIKKGFEYFLHFLAIFHIEVFKRKFLFIYWISLFQYLIENMCNGELNLWILGFRAWVSWSSGYLELR